MRILVTGGAGFIGRRVVGRLVADGHDVTLLDRSHAGIDRLDARIRHETRCVVAETSDLQRVAEAMRHQECVAHLAAGSSFLMYEQRPVPETAGAIVGFHNVLDAAVRQGIGRIVYLSTSAVYEGNPVPYREGMPLRPPDLKALAKKVNEEVAVLYQERHGIETVALRPFSVYGPGETTKGPYANIVSLFVWAMASGHQPVLWGNGLQTRDFIYVDDVARAVALALVGEAVGVFNVGTGIETKFSSVIALINDQLGTSIDPVPIDVPISVYATRLVADTTRAQRELGFVAKIPLVDGIDHVISSFDPLPLAMRERLAALHKRFSTGVSYSPSESGASPRLAPVGSRRSVWSPA